MGLIIDISIVDGGYKLTYNWGVPHCIGISFFWSENMPKTWRFASRARRLQAAEADHVLCYGEALGCG